MARFFLKNWRSLISILIIGLIAVPFFNNCSPTEFSNAQETPDNLSLAAQAVACGTKTSGSRWWELDVRTRSHTCPSGTIIQTRYNIEKICSNGEVMETGQSLIDSVSPQCVGPCVSKSAKWFMTEGAVREPLNCQNGQVFNNIYQRLVEYRCVKNISTPTGVIKTGALLLGETCSSAGTICGNDAGGVARAEGAIWQEPIHNLVITQNCPNNARGVVQLDCERLIEYKCSNGLRRLTERMPVTLSCASTNDCSSAPPTCDFEGATKQYGEVWHKRIAPDFSNMGACTEGGDFIITSQRLQSYMCHNGEVQAQSVLRGATIRQTGRCGPKPCPIVYGTGQQNWEVTSAGGGWGTCMAIRCHRNYMRVNNQCVSY